MYLGKVIGRVIATVKNDALGLSPKRYRLKRQLSLSSITSITLKGNSHKNAQRSQNFLSLLCFFVAKKS